MTSTIAAPHAVPDALVFGDPQLHTDGDLLALAFAPDGTLWSIEEPGVVRHWNRSGQELSWHLPSDLEDLWCISNDARVLASASNDLSVWDASSGNLLTALPQAVWVSALASISLARPSTRRALISWSPALRMPTSAKIFPELRVTRFIGSPRGCW